MLPARATKLFAIFVIVDAGIDSVRQIPTQLKELNAGPCSGAFGNRSHANPESPCCKCAHYPGECIYPVPPDHSKPYPAGGCKEYCEDNGDQLAGVDCCAGAYGSTCIPCPGWSYPVAQDGTPIYPECTQTISTGCQPIVCSGHGMCGSGIGGTG